MPRPEDPSVMIRALPTRPILLICLLIAAGLSAGALLCGRAGGLTGLMLTADSGPGTGLRAEPRRVSAVDARDLWVGGPGPVRAPIRRPHRFCPLHPVARRDV